ncbi:MAG: ornithine cyclodeaminase family protein [Bacillota bacterium]
MIEGVMQLLILNNKALQEALSPNEVMDSIEDAYRIQESKAMFMPDRIHVDRNGKTLLYMPCFAEDMFGTKFLTVFPDNPAKGHSAIDGLMVLNEYETGRTLAILDGKSLTSTRTGAVGGVAIRHTTPDSVSSVGIVGAGTQGYTQALFACKARNIEEVLVFDRYRDAVTSFVERLSEELPNVRARGVSTVEELLLGAEIVITATTSDEPVLPDDPSLLMGKHFVGIGSYKPTMREYPPALFGLVDKVYIDTHHAKEETGDLAYPLAQGLLREEQIETFGHFLLHEKRKESIRSGTTFVKSVGMALFDLVVSKLAYEKARELGLGLEVQM